MYVSLEFSVRFFFLAFPFPLQLFFPRLKKSHSDFYILHLQLNTSDFNMDLKRSNRRTKKLQRQRFLCSWICNNVTWFITHCKNPQRTHKCINRKINSNHQHHTLSSKEKKWNHHDFSPHFHDPKLTPAKLMKQTKMQKLINFF